MSLYFFSLSNRLLSNCVKFEVMNSICWEVIAHQMGAGQIDPPVIQAPKKPSMNRVNAKMTS